MTACAVAAALTLSLVAPGTAAETFEAFEERLARFQLFANCESMDLFVYSLDSDDQEFGLTEGRIRAAAESRLRSARIYSSNAVNYFSINVTVIAGAFSIIVEYNKSVFDALSGVSLFAPTWNNAVTGTHGKDAGYILSSLSELLDLFLVEYLRTNEEACATR